MSGEVPVTHRRALHTVSDAASPSASAPAIGAWVPTATVHIAFLAVATGLCLLVLEPPFWRAVGLLLAVTGTLVPSRVSPGWLLLVLALSQLGREPSATDIVFYLLLAGVHLLHLLSSLAMGLPRHGRIQVIALLPPFRRFVLIQAFVQAVAAGALRIVSGGGGTVSGLSILAAAMIATVAAVLARGVREIEARD